MSLDVVRNFIYYHNVECLFFEFSVENQSNVSKSTDADDDNDNAAATTTTTTDDNTNFRPINSKIINKESMNKSKSTTFVDALVEQPIIDCNLDRIKTRSCEANLQCKEHLKDISADDNAKKSVITNSVQIFDDYTLIDSEYTSNNSEYLQFNFSSRNILKRAVPGTWLYNKIITSTPILATKLLTMNMDVKSIEFAYMDPIKEIEINKQQPTLPI